MFRRDKSSMRGYAEGSEVKYFFIVTGVFSVRVDDRGVFATTTLPRRAALRCRPIDTR